MSGKKRPPGLCLHCQRRPAWAARGLCDTCYKTPAIKCLYKAAFRGDRDGADMTMAQLDALEAEQRENLPEWWGKDDRVAHKKHLEKKIALVRVLIVAQGRFYFR